MKFSRNFFAHCLLLAVVASGTSYASDPRESHHIEPGNRLPDSAIRMELQQERANRAEQSDLPYAGGGECDGDHCPVPVQPPKSSVHLNGAQAKTYYTTHCGAYHSAVSVSYYGDAVELEDGSIWSVKSSDAYKTLNWMTSDLILITQNSSWFSSYQYVLINVNTGVRVKVNLNLGPFYNGMHTHFIVSVDPFHYEIQLDDGSIWQISSFDSFVMGRWLPNDTIILGVNDDWLTQGNHPNILINVNTLEYAAGACIY